MEKILVTDNLIGVTTEVEIDDNGNEVVAQ